MAEPLQKRDFAAELGALGYPGFSYLKPSNRQNRLGFVVALASELAESKNDSERTRSLRQCLEILEGARLGCEDTFWRESMTHAEKAWLRENRSATAAHWNLLTDMKGKDLPYGAPW